MNLDQAYSEKGLAITQIELWQDRLKQANKTISEELMKQEKLKQDASKPAESAS